MVLIVDLNVFATKLSCHVKGNNMSRSGYVEFYDCDTEDMMRMNLYRGTVTRAIQGKRGQSFLQELAAAGYSATNIAFGMGGALLQQVNRDTNRFAYKCSSAIIDGVETDVFKAPTDEPFKKSKAGRFNDPKLVDVFLNGEVLKEYTLDEVRANAALK
jgi:hypothetical protein